MEIKTDSRQQRYSTLPFPPYRYVPGGDYPHPKKLGGHMYGEEDPKCQALSPDNPAASTHYLYGVDLFNAEFWWESHVFFEALWHASGRKDQVSDFLKALIKLAAAQLLLKKECCNPKAAQGHLRRAHELLSPLQQQYKQQVYAGIMLSPLLTEISSYIFDDNTADLTRLKHTSLQLKLILPTLNS